MLERRFATGFAAGGHPGKPDAIRRSAWRAKIATLHLLSCLVLGLIVSSSAAGADPDVVSPLASYVYLDTLADPPSQPNVVSLLVSYLYQDTLATSPDQPSVVSPLVSYLYHDSLATPPEQPNVVSPLVSYLYYDWLGDENLTFQNSPLVSFFFQPSTASGSITLLGRVTDALGVGISGATVSATVGLTPVAQTTTGARGNYTLPPLGGGVYVLSASAANYQTSVRALTLNAALAVQNFSLSVMPPAPTVVQTTRQPPPAFTQPPVGPLGSTLKIFGDTALADITSDNRPSSNRMTIVLTHGWNSDPTVWAINMAAQIRASGVTTNIANIVVWDWRYAAESSALSLVPLVEENTPDQGKALGTALQDVLSPGYTQPIHFIGHSLGALVNAAAANYLHGDPTAYEAVSPTPWRNLPMHMTLFDEAEVSFLAGGLEWIFDGVTVGLANVAQFFGNTPPPLPPRSSRGYKSPIPMHATWIDNYVSFVGYFHSEAVNVDLNKAYLYSSNPIQEHSYPMQWYGMSITNPTDANNPLGFQRSFEYAKLTGAPSSFPPSTPDFLPDVDYAQVPSSSDQLALERTFSVAQAFGITPSGVVQGSAGALQVVGNVNSRIGQSALQAGQLTGQGFNYAGNVAALGGQTLLNLPNSAVLRLTLTTGPASSSPQFSLRAKSLQDIGGGTNTPAMAWLPIQFPANATVMAFDFTVEGNPMDDVLVCGVETNNLFSLKAKYIPTNTMSVSRLIGVSAWAGTTNELFFGFMGGTSTNATLIIENIRFFSLAEPRLQISASGSMTLLSWPLTAGGYVLETTPTLTPPTWETVTNAPVISTDRYVLTNSLSEQSRFFRLRQQ